MLLSQRRDDCETAALAWVRRSLVKHVTEKSITLNLTDFSENSYNSYILENFSHNIIELVNFYNFSIRHFLLEVL